MDKKIPIIFGLIILVGVIDIFANVISFIPFIGDIAETVSESILETIQILLAGVLAAMAMRK